MNENQITVDNITHPLETPFVVLATQNPLEFAGTYPLPESQMDRFLLRIVLGYPSQDVEKVIQLVIAMSRRTSMRLLRRKN